MNDERVLQLIEIAMKSERAKIRRDVLQELLDVVSERAIDSEWKWRMRDTMIAHEQHGQVTSTIVPAALTMESAAAMLESSLQNLDEDLRISSLENAMKTQSWRDQAYRRKTSSLPQTFAG